MIWAYSGTFVVFEGLLNILRNSFVRLTWFSIIFSRLTQAHAIIHGCATLKILESSFMLSASLTDIACQIHHEWQTCFSAFKNNLFFHCLIILLSVGDAKVAVRNDKTCVSRFTQPLLRNSRYLIFQITLVLLCK